MKRLLLLGCVLTALHGSLYAQRDPSREILVYFVDGVKREKQSANGTVPYKQQLRSSKLKSKLAELEISEDMLETAMPNFNEADTLKTTRSGEQISMLNMSKLCRIKVKPGQSREQLIKKLRDLPEVLYAEANGLVAPLVIPTDGSFGLQWGLRNTSTPGEDIHAEAAWDIYTGNPNNIIAIVDGGVLSTHVDLDAKIAGGDSGFGWNSHGIHVAGIAAAETNNGTEGIAGVDWNAKIHAQRIDNVSDDAGTLQAIIDAVNYSSNAFVLNHSWGLVHDDQSPGRYSVTVRQGFAYAYKNNRTSVVAMGNHQVTNPNVVAYPAGFDKVIAIGATGSTGTIANFSAQGPHIDVSAPGENIYSSVSGGYDYKSGTSMATPHVSGIASLLKGFAPNLSNDDIENVIRLSADDKGAAGFDNTFGTGRVNAERALNYLRAPYTLQQLTATGGILQSTTSSYLHQFHGAHPGLATGTYVVKRKEIRKTVTFPAMCQIVGVWGTGVGSAGWSLANPNYGEGHVEIVPGTLTSTSATLRTYVYEMWTIGGSSLGHYPTSPANATFKYSILGILSPAIAGNSIICNSQTYEIANLTAGATVAWSSTWNSAPYPTLVQNSPTANKLTINNTYMYPSTTTLTATITGHACPGPVVVTKSIASDYVSQVQYGTYTQEACWFYNTYNPASSGSLPTTANTPLYLRQGCMAVITLDRMVGKTVTFIGSTPVLYWSYDATSSKLYVQLPYMSGGIPFTFKISGAGACQDKTILFFAYSQPYYPTYTFSASPNPATTNTLTISATPNSERLENAVDKNAIPAELRYSARIVDLLTGQVVVDNLRFTGRLKEQVDISKLGKGFYTLQIFSEGQSQNIRFSKE